LNLNLAEISGLKSTLENERNSNLKKVQELNDAIVNFENQISLLKSEVKEAINNLNQKQLENTQLKADLNLYLTEIITLKIQFLNKGDSLNIISNELKKIKTTTQSTNSNISVNKNLIPQEIENYDKPAFKYIMNNKTIVLDGDSETKTIRMKINNRIILLKMQEKNFTKFERVFSNSEYIVTFFDILYGECTGEGNQAVTGKLRIESKTEFNIINFNGYDGFFSSKKCKEMGNG